MYKEHYIKIKIKTIDSNIHDVKISLYEKVSDLKKYVENVTKIAKNKQRLIFQGRVLSDEMQIKDCKLEDGHVIHLVEQTINQVIGGETNERPSLVDDNHRNFLDMLLGSIPSLSNSISNRQSDNANYLTNLFSNTFNNLHIIPESFKSLEQRNNFNKVEHIEVIKQNINNMNEIIKATVNLSTNSNTKQLFNTNLLNGTNPMNPNNKKYYSFKIGQWIDAQDTLEQWLEAQILDIKDNKAYIHYSGWQNDWNEWLPLESPRLALFRTYTLQSPFVKYNSSFPNSKSDNDRNVIFTNVQNFDNFDNLDDIVNFLDTTREKIIKFTIEKENLFKKQKMQSSYEEITYRENLFNLSIMQMYPILDRLGRLLTDFANYMFNYSFRKFEENIEKFKSNFSSNDLNFSNINNEGLLNHKIFLFQKLTQIPIMRNSGEIAEANNLHRPRVGIIIGMNNEGLNRINTNANSNNIVINRFSNLSVKREINYNYTNSINKILSTKKEAMIQTINTNTYKMYPIYEQSFSFYKFKSKNNFSIINEHDMNIMSIKNKQNIRVIKPSISIKKDEKKITKKIEKIEIEAKNKKEVSDLQSIVSNITKTTTKLVSSIKILKNDTNLIEGKVQELKISNPDTTKIKRYESKTKKILIKK